MRPSPSLLTALACVLAVGTACSAVPDDAAGASSAATPAATTAEDAPEPVTLRAERTPADAPGAVLSAPDAVTGAVQASAALFASSPVAVLVDVDDAGSFETAAQQATTLGVPLLLTSAAATAADGAVATELARLASTDVLAVGDAALEAAGGLDGVAATARAEDLPDLEALPPAPGTTVLTAGAPTDAAALATAAAAGADVVTVAGADPRADPAAIEALSAAAPTRVVALGAGFGPLEVLAPRVAAPATGVQLPGGGQLVLAGKRYAALYGHPGTPALGLLGEQDLDAAVARAQELAASYQPLSDVPVVPTFEVITTVASGSAGADGNYSNEVDPEKLRPWIEEAGRQGVYVLLDLQPGTTDFRTQAERYETLLAYPHVGLALDPEWRLEPGQRHLEQIGSVSAEEVNSVSQWLADLVRERGLPQKMLVLHQFRTAMITGIDGLETGLDEVAVVIHADGNGTQGAKAATWERIVAGAPDGVAFAWKNFVDEDSPMLTPEQTMAVRPTPVLVTYQ